MTPSLLANLAAYSGQIAVIVALAALALAAGRIDAAGARSLCLRGLLLLCLALPWIQPRHAAAARAGVSDARITSDITVTAAAAPVAAPVVDWAMVVLAVLGVGLAGRLAWIGAGLWRLRGLRRSGTVIVDCPEHDDLQRLLGTRAEIRSVPGLGQPVTFGTLRPVVLLPEALHAHSSDVQRAVLAHELFHVQRRDSAWLIAEEILRALFWFHPAMWWLISRVQLAREEVVDELVVLLTSRRKVYAEALIAFADDTPLAPLAAFARRRHLIRRVSLISREGVMSSRQIVSAVFAVVIVVASGGRYVVQALPLQQMVFAPKPAAQAGPLEQRALAATPENPVPRRLASEAPLYPAEAANLDARGSVTLRLVLDASGRVAEARVLAASISSPTVNVTLSQPDLDAQLVSALRGAPVNTVSMARQALGAMTRSALAAVTQWAYEVPHEAPIWFVTTVQVGPDGPAPSARTAAPVKGTQRAGVSTPREVPPESRSVTLGGETYRAPQRPADGTLESGALRIGGAIKAPVKIKNVPPVYPQIAKDANVQGIVIIEARIEADGTISGAAILKSIPLLDQAALDAVRQWQFAPTLLNGEAVPVVMTLTVNFTLAPKAEASFDPLSRDHVAPKLVKEVKPVYSKEAMDAKVQGHVFLQAQIDANGKVVGTRVTGSIPLLDDSAIAAVRQWEFVPATLNGQPVPVAVDIEMAFTLK